MIRFRNLTKGFWVRGEWAPVINGLNLTLPTGKSLALLGGNGAGKSTLLSMIAGTLRPDAGSIWSDGTISWPIGYSGSFHKDLTGEQNTRFIARVYGVDTDELSDFVQDFAEIGKHYYMPLRTYSSGMRSRLNFGLSMGVPFDTYLIDEVTSVGDQNFRLKSRVLFKERMKTASAIMVSHNLEELRQYCDGAILLHKGQLSYFDNLDEALEAHRVQQGGTA